jgi:acetyltransferase-like isoleucine patch superfamily enzyme
MSLKEKIKGNPDLKKLVHWMLIAPGEARPRLWVRLFLNPFIHHYGKGSKVRYRTRMDVLPFNKFSLGKGSTIESFSTVNNGVGDVIIGDGTLIGMSNVIIGPVNIGNNVILAQNIVVSGLNHEYRNTDIAIKDQKIITATITIEDDCWIAANAVITAGVTIGKHSVVGGGAVITRDVPAYSVAVGNPARIIKRFDFEMGNWISVK